jgi:hypothetical protein
MGFIQKIMRKVLSLQEGPANRVIFYYVGEEPTYLEDAHVTLYGNGVVEVRHRNEHVTTHVKNVEISWKSSGVYAGTGGRSLSLVKNEAPALNPN